MQIDRLTHAAISTLFKAYDASAHDEIEALYTGEPLDRVAMQRLLGYLRTTTARRLQGSEVQTHVMLDISVEMAGRLGGVRVTLEGEAVVRGALGNPSHQAWTSATVIHKRRLRPSVDVHEHRLRVNLKREEPVDKSGEVAEARAAACSSGPGGARRLYRLKRRFSFPSVDELFRYDVTAVRQILHQSPSWAELSDVPERYEVECEMVGPLGKGETADRMATSLLKSFGTLLKVLDDTDRLMTVTQRNMVLTEFLSLMFPADKNAWTSQVVAGAVQPRFLPGPKPVTLESHHLIERERRSSTKAPVCEDGIEDMGETVSAVSGVPYTVTEKADGVHRVLFVSREGRAYTLSVDGVVKVRDSGLSCRAGGRGTASILDGEFIQGTSLAGAIFAAYDAFFFEGVDVRRLALMLVEKDTEKSKTKTESKANSREVHSRLEACQVVSSALASVSSSTTADATRVIVKRFLRYDGDMHGLTSCVRQIMARRDAANFPYTIDGIILTPAAWPVGAMSATGDAKSDSVTWQAVLKWKPPDQNSIDFLVRLVPGEIVRRDSVSYRVAHLYVGYLPSKWNPVTTLALLTDAVAAPVRGGGPYMERLFGIPGEEGVGTLHVCHLRVVDGDEDRVLCKNGEDIVDATIVEFAYDMTPTTLKEDGSFRWVPLRPRPDKTQRYLTSGGEIAGAANDIRSALSVWMSIQAPITEDVMCGRTERQLTTADDTSEPSLPAAYYLKKVRPGDGGLACMRDFHNWVKSSDLLMRLKGPTTRSLFDIGCGRAGDLHTWRKLGVSRVLGVDLFRSGIVDPENGANVRILEMKRRNGRRGDPFPRIVLLPMDASLPLDAMQIDGMDEQSGDRQVARVIWSLVDAGSVRDERLRRYHGFAGAGFDVVSCQFAVHYFFRTPVTLAAFASNVARNIRRGGFFVGTCMDAHRVHAAFGAKQCIQGLAGGKVIWRLQKLYDAFDGSDSTQNTGLRIKVYVQTIGQVLEEFLVDYRLLRSAMAQVGLVPPDAEQLGTLGLTEKQAPDGTCTFESAYARMSVVSSSTTDPHVTSALAMTEAERQFSFLNRWFVFVKARPSKDMT